MQNTVPEPTMKNKKKMFPRVKWVKDFIFHVRFFISSMVLEICENYAILGVSIGAGGKEVQKPT